MSNSITVKNNIVTVKNNVTDVITVTTQGPQGIQGSQGIQGPIGNTPVFDSGSYATTGSNTFVGLQTISSSIDLSGLDIHVKDDILWTFRTYNDTYSPTLVGLASWIDNDGVSFLGTETNKPLHIYNNANYHNPTLLVSSSGVTINNTVTVTNGITGSLYGTSSWATKYNETEPLFTSVSGTFATTGSNVFKGNQTISGSTSIYVSLQTAYGLNENPGNDNIFFAYPPLYPDTVNVQVGWTAVVDGGGTYTVSNVQPDTPFAPFTSITLDDPGLTLGYRVGVTFTREPRLWKFNNDGTTNIPSNINLSGSINFGNSHSLNVDNLSGLITLTNNAGQGLRTSHVLSGRTTTIGDYANANNGVKLIVDDYNHTIIASGSLDVSGSINGTAQVYEVSLLETASPPYNSGSNIIVLDQDIITNPNYTRNTNTITVNSFGLYKIYVQCRFEVASGLTDEAEMAVFINNNPYRTYYIKNIKSSEISTYNFSCVANLNVGDTIELYISTVAQPFVLYEFSKIYTSVINSYMTIEKLN